jgi:FkbM family methyltransferase
VRSPDLIARSLVRRWRARKPGIAVVAGERFLLEYPFSRFQPGAEAAMLTAYSDSAGQGLAVFDIGANAGIYSLVAARRGAKVVAFEPSRAAAALMRRHLMLNDLEAEIVEACIADQDGTIAFFEQGSATTSSISESTARTGEVELDEPVVETMRPVMQLDSYCTQAGVWPDVVKLDVEGAEAQALRGASEWLERRQGTLFLEVHPWALAQFGTDDREVMDLLATAGWGAELLEENPVTRHFRVTPLTRL